MFRTPSNERLGALFLEVRQKYFPRWDKGSQWRIIFGTSAELRHATGYCDSAQKTIFLDEREFTGMILEGKKALIIHEICHDVASAGHIRSWALRMERAAHIAEAKAESGVAQILRSDIYSYFGERLSHIYNRSTVLIFCDEELASDPVIEYEELRKRLSRFFGHNPTKIERDFGRLVRSMSDSRDQL